MRSPINNFKTVFARSVVLSGLMVAALLWLQGCQSNQAGTGGPSGTATPAGKSGPGSSTRATPRVAVPMAATPIVATLSFAGEVRAREQINISPKASGRIAELKAGVGDAVKKNDLLVVLEHSVLDIQVKQAEVSLSSAQASLAGAKAQLDSVRAGSTKEAIAGAEAAVRTAEANMANPLAGATDQQIAAAEANLAVAQAKLDLLLAGPRPEQVTVSKFLVDQAKQAQAVTNQQTATYSSTSRTEAYDKLGVEQRAQAQMAVDMANYQLQLALAPPRPEDVAQLKGSVDAAKATLDGLKTPPRPQQVAQQQALVDAAKASLESLKAPPKQAEVSRYEAAVEQAKAQVAAAEAALALAKVNRDESFLYSPMDGVVTAKGAGLGSLASVGTAILTITSKEVEVVVAADAAALAQLPPGQAISITALAYPGEVFPGKVRAVGQLANATTRTFDVYVDTQDPRGLLRAGIYISASGAAKN